MKFFKLVNFIAFLLLIGMFAISCDRKIKVKGEIFYAAGGEGSFAISRMQVKVFKKHRIGDIKSNDQIPDLNSITPDAETVSDLYGKFELNLEQGEYVIFAEGQREILGKTKNLKWVVSANIPKPDYDISLNNMNLR